MSAPAFKDRERVDARAKVTGATEYPADIAHRGTLFAMTVPARIAKGHLTALATDTAASVPGVVRILTPDDFPPPPKPTGFAPPPPTLVRQIAYLGQPVALVVAETLEAAIEGAEAVRATYAEEPFSVLVTDPGAVTKRVKDVKAGDAAQAMASAVTTIEVEYDTPPQHHNPIELLITTAIWSGGRLTIHESTQGASVVKAQVATSLGLDPAIIDVKSSYIGGSFGQKGSVQVQTAIVARAAILTRRPVKLVMPRGQIFHVATFRPLSRHRIKIGTDTAGMMIAVNYDADHQQSRHGWFAAEYYEAPLQMYGIPHVLASATDLQIDTQGPGYMRTPLPHPGCFAFEGAIDELALKLGRDPVEFRLAHDAKVDPLTGHPLSSCFLNECIVEGARRFGWERRNPKAGATVLADGTQVGWGVACGAYPASTSANISTLRIGANGTTRFAVSGHEMGQGIRNVIAAVLLRELDIDPAKLEIVLGDTTAVPQHMTAGSWGTASAAPVAEKAARMMKASIAELLAGRPVTGNLHRQLAKVKRPFVEIAVSQLGPGQDPKALDQLRQSGFAISGPEYPTFTSFSYIAHFVEVHVEPRTRRVRVRRVVSVADCGRVISPRTAASQVRGGVVGAIGSALREATEVDARFGGWLNNDLADYVVPVNADIGDIEVGFIDRPDPLLNVVGAKGLGEVAMAGAAGAVANAIYHATGRRIRKMPIRIEDLLRSSWMNRLDGRIRQARHIRHLGAIRRSPDGRSSGQRIQRPPLSEAPGSRANN
ncbi:xanthine dehydrogenase family protein molybdopterin-binding subunit [Xanthomonas arboricola]|uniref:xanthine dehydrogenase family protein molybdopterin-binding subunit n=1 Tax=Xanthomonas arboricola TaxID=56448 RepID=UPI001BB052BE|nr:xanthine dehydrogenase family protein molybdopterin-binding subunit [Xanthomonas arboricola]MDN0209265.1 xanthine dehydrogenase family protein molybdopterin-binding subunit [Xanthomonas arboricola pv. corylina]MDN0213650.1 xanthine dehydrogenase family protein molybdopterin-binding subunit [Xanthomonas arboricola pv. corylina]QUI82634.1 xanthine dehydrogenase family protein molybdopterin-binding subunit [Xanthomonas arboricola pv. corylina]UQQ12698.1 xanthine dehydrogenase family protein mol